MTRNDTTPFNRLAREPCPPAPRAQDRPTAIITGIGLQTPLGRDAKATWNALLANQFITTHAHAAGHSPDSPDPTPRIRRMVRAAAAQAITQANWTDDRADVPVIVGTSKGSVESWLAPLQHMAITPYIAGGPSTAGLSDIAADLAHPLAPKLTLAAACASGLVALIRAAMLIESGQARRVLVVAAEASVHPLFLATFNRLGVLAKPPDGCKPFDRNRTGFLMSEAAAALCLEASENNRLSNPQPFSGRACWPSPAPATPRIAIDRYACAADAHHLTAADPHATILRHLINKVTHRQPLDLIHAHGTGTIANDPVELAALESVLSETQFPTPHLYSHKAALGHSLGAAGLVAIVLNVLAHHHHTIPPNVRTTDPLPTTRLTLNPTAVHRPIRRSLTVASGFGGAMAAITLQTL